MRDKNHIASSSCPFLKKVENNISQFAVQGARGFIQDEDRPLNLKARNKASRCCWLPLKLPSFMEYKFERLCAETTHPT